VYRDAQQRRLHDGALLERRGQRIALEVLQARPQADVHRRRVLRLDASDLLERPRQRHDGALEQPLASQQCAVELPLAERLHRVQFSASERAARSAIAPGGQDSKVRCAKAPKLLATDETS